ncbi:MAG TPA: RluA family pseudouridine synthase [bacterium]|nr:RluA family pseudouridine synthase [bacterium]HPL95543.1 RluA family pseudouridine synthase [bacterium]
MAGQKFIVTDFQVNERLDKFLSQKFPALSRSKLQELVKAGFVFVNQKKVTPHYFLKEKDIIEIKKLEIKKLESNKTNDKKINIKIIAENNDYLVINKPAGILVHPTAAQENNTLVDWLIRKYPAIKKVYDRENKDGKIRPGIVHRLDRDVSGLMVIAKTQKMFNSLKEQFKTRQIKKEYLALVYGSVNLDSGRIERVISRSARTGLMTAHFGEVENGKEAITEFEVVKRFKSYTLLKIVLLTGRTHQIRVHLKSIGHSIVGDKLYQTKDLRHQNKKSAPDFIFLYAAKLGFYDLNHDWQEFKLSQPIKFKKFLAAAAV